MAISITKKTSTHNTTESKGRSILYLVIHYTAGTTSKAGSAANIASYFSTTENQVSADFIVDDETIVQYNPDIENRYCWHCDGSKYSTKGGSLYGVAKNANSIGIEICSTNSMGKVTTANDQYWSYTDAVLEKALELLKYLMEKYGINADHVIRHYDVNGKPCPGIIGWNEDTGDVSKWQAFKAKLVGITMDDGSMTDAEMYAFFMSQGLNDYGASGLMGNLYAESALAANNLQNTGNTKLGMTDAEYTSAVDSGSYANFVNDGYGYGLAQWTYYSRKQALLDFMAAAGVSIGHKRKQCEFIMQELSFYSSVLKTLKNAASVLEASNAVLTGYEKPADQSESVQAKRAGYGQTYYHKYADNASADAASTVMLPDIPFTVKVLISDLNYRSEPSMSGTVEGQTGKGTFTIIEVSNGWGRLKSGAGWIYLLNTSYCTVGSTVTENSSYSASSVPYTVKVTISNLNIRKGLGTNYDKTGKYTGNGTFTIVEEASGTGSTKGWGLLKSGAGWISLDYATKI